MVSDGGKEILVSPRYQKVLELRIFELGQGSRNQSPEDIYMIYIWIAISGADFGRKPMSCSMWYGPRRDSTHLSDCRAT